MLDGKKTLITNTLVTVAGFASLFGIDVGLDGGAASSIAVGIVGLINLVLRFFTKGPINLGK